MEEKDPDVIPPNKELIEEEEAFHNFRERQRARYTSATLQRDSPSHAGGGGLTDCCDSGRNFRNNFSRLSQEVTYAEFTMPRNKGYAPMKQRAVGVDSPKLIPASLPVKPKPPAPPPRYTSPPSTSSLGRNQTSPSSSTSTIQGKLAPNVGHKATRNFQRA